MRKAVLLCASPYEESPLLFTILLAAGLVGIDQLTKFLAAYFLAPAGSVTVIPRMLAFSYHQNTGAAFSILQGRQGLLIGVTSVVLLAIFLGLMFRRPKDKLEYVAAVMVLAGGVGNLIDRIANGYVVDFINLLFVNFAIFNVADCLVVVGFVLLVVAVFRLEYRESKKKKARLAQPEDEMAERADGEG